MNLILLTKNDFINNKNLARIEDYRHKHVLKIIKAEKGDNLNVGLINEKTGTGTVTGINQNYVEMEVSLSKDPPPPLPLTLILALPRPKVLKRILLCVSSMGVKTIYLINSWRVEKSFWQSPVLNKKKVHEQFIYGLEQAGDTILPEIYFRKLFKPFVEDELPEIIKNTKPVVAHPGSKNECPRELNKKITLAIGPEGGFIPYEIKKLGDSGFTPVTLGARVFRVEHVIPYILARLF